ncbi:hypothetical protein FQR65_LT06189 [Abscondita terminalis]|nr:hypothetical protein FQR65_LT06189 [Abscondita terminalis]
MNTTKTVQTVNDLIHKVLCSDCNVPYQIVRKVNRCTHLYCGSCCLYFDTCTGNPCYRCKTPYEPADSILDYEMACIFSHLKVVHRLNFALEQSQDSNVTYLFTYNTFNYKKHHNGETRLHKECRSGNFQEVQSLVESGMDVNVQDYAGWTPLHEAVLNQRADEVKYLLVHGAYVNIPGLDYLTPLHSAVQEKNLEIIEALVEHGADCLAYNKDGKTPLDLCKEDDIRNAICLTPSLPSIIRTYTMPDKRLFLHNVDKDFKELTTKDIVILKKRNLFKVGDVKYFVVGNNNPDVKYLQAAMLQGAFVVTMDFLNDLMIENVTINPMNYLANIPNFDISKAALNVFNKLPKLFDGIHFYFINYKPQKINNVPYSLDDVKTLILLGGGKIDARMPSESSLVRYFPYHTDKTSNSASTNYYLLYNETNKNFKKKVYSKEIKYQTLKWLIDCINSFSILP